MKILILTSVEPGGEWIATQTLVEELKKLDRSIKFYLVAPVFNKNLIKKSLFTDIGIVRKNTFDKPFKYYRQFLSELLSGAKVIDEVYRNNQIDKVIVTNHALGLSYILSQKNVSYLYSFHNVKNNFKIFSETFNHFLILQKIVEVIVWTMAKKIIIPAQMARRVIVDHSGFLTKNKEFVFVPNLIRHEFQVAYSEDQLEKFRLKYGLVNKNIILYSGRLVRQKGVENLINAFNEIRRRYKNIVLLIASNDLESELAARSIPNDGILLLRKPTARELAICYKAASMAVLPSRFDISPLFFKEAIFSNLPFFSADIGDIGTTLNKLDKKIAKSFILEDESSDILIKKINSFLNKKSFYQKRFFDLSEKFKSMYNEEKILDKWSVVLKN